MLFIIFSVLLLSFLSSPRYERQRKSFFIISSVLLLSFLSSPRYEHQRKSVCFYYFFCVVAFFSSSPRYERQRKSVLLFLLSCCFLSIFATIRAPKKGKFLSVCEVESNVCRQVCLVKNLHCVSSVCSGSYDWKKSFSAQDGEPLVKASVCTVQWLIYGKTLQCVRGVWVDWRVCVMVHVLKKIQCV